MGNTCLWVAQLTIPVVATVTSIPGIQQKLNDVPGGSEFITAVNTLNMFVGILSAAELATAAPDICKTVVDRWKTIRQSSQTKAALGNKFDKIDESIDQLDDFVGSRVASESAISSTLRNKIYSTLSKSQADELVRELEINSSLRNALEADKSLVDASKALDDAHVNARLRKNPDVLKKAKSFKCK